MAEVLALAAAVVLLATAVAGWMAARAARAARRQTQQVGRQVQEVHLLVNSRLTAALARMEQLTEALKSAGVAVPPAPPAEEEPG